MGHSSKGVPDTSVNRAVKGTDISLKGVRNVCLPLWYYGPGVGRQKLSAATRAGHYNDNGRSCPASLLGGIDNGQPFRAPIIQHRLLVCKQLVVLLGSCCCTFARVDREGHGQLKVGGPCCKCAGRIQLLAIPPAKLLNQCETQVALCGVACMQQPAAVSCCRGCSYCHSPKGSSRLTNQSSIRAACSAEDVSTPCIVAWCCCVLC